MPNYSTKDIKRVAKRNGYYELEVSPRDEGRMVSWRHDEKSGGVRINIYFTTGTVATCLYHSKRGKSQLFRRNMTYADLEDIFQNPRVHTDAGYHRLGDGTKVRGNRVAALSTYGYYFEDEDILEDFVSDSFPIDKDFESISIGFDCFFILQNDGTFMHSSGLPKGLFNKLKGRQSWLPRPEIVQLGKRSCQSYFIQFADGQSQWADVPTELDKLLDNSDEIVDVIAIGDGEDYYVKFQDGSEHWSLPIELSKLLNGRSKRGKPDVAHISLGGNGRDYAVKFTDGSISSWCTKSDYNSDWDRVQKKAKSGVKHVELGPGDDFVIIG